MPVNPMAFQELRKNNFREAFLLAQPDAEKGDLDSLYFLTTFYLVGDGTEKNEAKGIDIMKLVASSNECRNSGYAAYFLGLYYLQGKYGLIIDIAKAKQWYFLAKSKGIFIPYGSPFDRFDPKLPISAKHAIHLRYAIEFYSKGEYDNALNLLANDFKEDCVAQMIVGQMYKYGLGVEEDIDKAIEWLEKSANLGNGESAYQLYLLYTEEKLDSSGDSLTHKKVEADKWRAKARELGFEVYLEQKGYHSINTNYIPKCQNRLS